MASVIRGAEFSPCRRYRYALWRTWHAGSLFEPGVVPVVFIGLNPSTADETQDDPTVRRCIGFAKRWGYGGLIMLNLFAYRSTDPAGLRTAADPVGPGNDAALLRACEGRSPVVAAWGVRGAYRGRGEVVRRMLPHLHHLGLTHGGHPRHPLYLRGDLTLQSWEEAA